MVRVLERAESRRERAGRSFEILVAGPGADRPLMGAVDLVVRLERVRTEDAVRVRQQDDAVEGVGSAGVAHRLDAVAPDALVPDHATGDAPAPGVELGGARGAVVRTVVRDDDQVGPLRSLRGRCDREVDGVLLVVGHHHQGQGQVVGHGLWWARRATGDRWDRGIGGGPRDIGLRGVRSLTAPRPGLHDARERHPAVDWTTRWRRP